MKKNSLLIASFAIGASVIVAPNVVGAQELSISYLAESHTYYYKGSYATIYKDQWDYEKPFSLDGQLYNKGIGLYPTYSDSISAHAKFVIKDFNYTTFEALIGIDDTTRKGDFGSGTLNIYADNVLIYTKNYKNLDSAEIVKAHIPKNTEHIEFKFSTEKGSAGKYRLVMANPKFSNHLNPISKVNTQSLVDIGVSDQGYFNHIAIDEWDSRNAFKNEEKFVNKALGFKPTYTGSEHVFGTFKIEDYSYTTFETILSVDANFNKGDRGKTAYTIYADEHPIYTKIIDNKTKPEHIKVAIPQGTSWIKMTTVHDQGKQGYQAVILENPVLTNEYDSIPAIKGVALNQIKGINNDDVSFIDMWGASDIFTDAKANPITAGIGFKPYFSHQTLVEEEFYIGDYDYPIFDTIFTLDSNKLYDKSGNITIKVLADNKKSLGWVTLNSKNPSRQFTANIPKNTERLNFQIVLSNPQKGLSRLVAIHPILREGFTDIPYAHSYYKAVNYLTHKKVINGYPDGTFKPSNTLTRSHAAMLISRALQLTNSDSMKFTDVSKTSSGYGEIAAAVNEGLFDDIVKDGKFNPTKPLTRGEMADIIAKAFELKSSSVNVFKDTSSHWANNSIMALYDNGITTGYEDKTFKPNETLTRGHFTLFMARAFNESFR